ncbi:MAG: 2-dehydro-3-deoxygalactonokinase [Rhodomicrobium sp.]|nr:2-dehydro-3-deoxygalactonokinase [Rhodomicrobium sp.]
MSNASRIDGGTLHAGDWGTTSLRVYLCKRSDDGIVRLAEASGPGAMSGADAETAFFSTAGEWLAAEPKLPVFLCGMAGSTIGWRAAPMFPVLRGSTMSPDG